MWSWYSAGVPERPPCRAAVAPERRCPGQPLPSAALAAGGRFRLRAAGAAWPCRCCSRTPGSGRTSRTPCSRSTCTARRPRAAGRRSPGPCGATHGARVLLQGGQHPPGQAPAAPLGYHEHPLDLGVAVPVAVGVEVLGAPAAGRHRPVPLVVGDQIQTVRRHEHRRIERCDIALVAVALGVFELHLVIEFDGVGVVEGPGVNKHAEYRISVRRGGVGTVSGC